MIKQAIFQIPMCKTEKAKQRRANAIHKLVEAIPDGQSHANTIARALNISRGNAAQILTLESMSLSHVDKLSQDGYDEFKMLAKNARITRDDLSGGAPKMIWSDWVDNYDVAALKAQFPHLIVRNFNDKNTVCDLINTFGMGGMAKLFQVPRNTVKNWHTYKKLPIIYLTAIHVIAKIRKEVEANGFDIWTIDPQITPELMSKIKRHHYSEKTADRWEVISL